MNKWKSIRKEEFNDKATSKAPDDSDLQNVSGGDKYTKVNGNNFEVWFRCPKCNKYETMIFSHQNDGHMLTKLVLGGTFFAVIAAIPNVTIMNLRIK